MRIAAAKTGRQLIRLMAMTALAAIAVQLSMDGITRSKIEPGAFVLEPSGPAYLLRMAGLILLFEIAPTLYSAGIHRLEMHPWIRASAVVAVSAPLIAGGCWLQLTEFQVVYVDPDGIRLRGASALADRDYSFVELDQVAVKHGSLANVLLFRWYDDVRQSCWVYPFDRKATTELKKLLAELKVRHFKIHVEKTAEITPAKKRHPASQ